MKQQTETLSLDTNTVLTAAREYLNFPDVVNNLAKIVGVNELASAFSVTRVEVWRWRKGKSRPKYFIMREIQILGDRLNGNSNTADKG